MAGQSIPHALTERVRRAVAATVVVVAFLGAAGESLAAGGNVLPPQARLRGWTRADMTKALAAFTTSGNDPAFYPDTPFQALYVDHSTIEVHEDGGGLFFTGTNVFTVPRQTMFFVPVWNVNDSPPIIGDFPETMAEAVSYFFDADQVGGQGFAVVVDGQVTPLGPEYLAGPVATPLPDGGSHMVTVGAFLTPFSVGTHTVRILGGIFGDLVGEALGVTHLRQDLTYTVHVVKA